MPDESQEKPRRSRKVTSLKVAREQPDARVVSLCQELLARARRGELVSIAIAMQTQGAGTATSFEMGEGDTAHLVLAIERLKLRLLGY